MTLIFKHIKKHTNINHQFYSIHIHPYIQELIFV